MSRFPAVLLILLGAGTVVPEHFRSGFTHVIPDGPDHVLFLLGLFFLSRDIGVLLTQMTLFTLAHSLTLGLSLHGIVSVPSGVVEVAIAQSIAFIAIENLICDGLSRWRPWVVFGSGLIHGLGFAHSFGMDAVATGDFLPALFSFNVGIECGQIAVMGIAYAAVGLWWKRDFYQKIIARPASVMIAASGLYWAAERGI